MLGTDIFSSQANTTVHSQLLVSLVPSGRLVTGLAFILVSDEVFSVKVLVFWLD